MKVLFLYYTYIRHFGGWVISVLKKCISIETLCET